jgi:hypothetical protein
MTTKATLVNNIGMVYGDNTAGAITPAVLRTQEIDEVNSWQQAPAINLVTGAAYNIQVSDYGQLLMFTAATVAVSIPAASALTPFNVLVKFVGTGTLTITPASGQIDGSGTLVLNPGQSTWLVSDGTNYRTTLTSSGGAAGVDSITAPAAGTTLTGAVTLAAGTGMTLTTAGQTVTFAATTGGTGNVVGTGTSVAGHIPKLTNTTTTAIQDTSDWAFDGSHNLIPTADAVYDIGLSGTTNRVRNVFISGTYNGAAFSGASIATTSLLLTGTGSGVLTIQSASSVSPNYTLQLPGAPPTAAAGMVVSAPVSGVISGSYSTNLGVIASTANMNTVFYNSSSGVTTALGLGTAHTTLRSAGMTSAPAFEAPASAAEYQAGTVTKLLENDLVWAAAAKVTLFDATTIVLDLNTGLDFIVMLTATGHAFGTPQNAKPGQKGVIYIVQPASGGPYTLNATWDSAYKFSGATKPTLSTAANAVDLISYVVRAGPTTPTIDCFFTADMR